MFNVQKTQLPKYIFLFSTMIINNQFSSVAQSCPTLCNPMDYSMPGFLVHHQLLELAQIHVHCISHAIQPSHPLSPHESALHIRWPKYWSFSFSIGPSSEYSGLISFRKDWLDLLAVQGALKSLLQHHSSKASILQPSAFFIVQLSHPYMTTRKTKALTRWTFVGKVMSLLFNKLSESESAIAQSCPTLCNPIDCSLQVSLSMGFPRLEYWSGLPFSSPGDLPNPGIESESPTLQADALPSEPPGKSISCLKVKVQ